MIKSLIKGLAKVKEWLGLWTNKTQGPIGFDANRALELAALCLDMTSLEVSNHPKLANAIDNKDMSVQVGLFKLDPTTVAVIFRGTEAWDMKDWRTNMQFPLNSTKNALTGKLHQGYWLAYTAIRKQLFKTLRKLKAAKVFVAGHSMGGALAQIFTADALEGDLHVNCYAFGSPKCGDKVWAKNYEKIEFSWRVRLFNDPIPALPPFKAYRHAGKGVRLHHKGYFMSKLDDLGNWLCLLWPFRYRDHRLGAYIDVLIKLLKRRK